MVEEVGNHDPLIGATLGGLYRVESLIGVGGMGRVYRATHTLLAKSFAVKVLPEGRAEKPDATERFLREARAASKIDNEHIVKVANVDRDGEHRLFIVMELLEGETLAERLERGPLPLEQALRIASQTGNALQAAHDAGIVHRDLKPENIFIVQRNGSDFVKVLDFGISKIKTPDHGDPKLTATDQIVGTPLYISPELARGVAAIDHRTDIYALGVIVYEMLTGTPPFTGQNHFQLLYKHGNEAPDPPSQRSKKAEIPAHVESAILRALEKDPNARFGDMEAFCAALRRPNVARRVSRFGLASLGAAIIAAVAFAVWPDAGGERTRAPTRPDADVVSASATSADAGGLPALPAPSDAAAVTKKSDDSADLAEPDARGVTDEVRLRSRPEGAFVTINGEKRGRTPLTVELERGEQVTVRFSLSGYQTERRRFRAGEQEELRIRLKKKRPPEESPIKTSF
jgi:serine/threonine-protein kinase